LTIDILSESIEKGEEYEESADVKLIPIFACFIAAQSFAPSPIIPTVYPKFSW
jgi:hypothetical protein